MKAPLSKPQPQYSFAGAQHIESVKEGYQKQDVSFSALETSLAIETHSIFLFIF